MRRPCLFWPTHSPLWVLAVGLSLLLLAACVEIEGGVERPETPGAALPGAETTATPTGTPTATTTPDPAGPTATSTPQTESAAEDGISVFQIGLLTRPSDLLPYHTNTADERTTSSLTELLFPEPLLAVNYTYTATGILERLPDVASGDVELRTVEVYLDATGQITTEETETITTAQQLVITYRWNPALSWSDGTPVTAADSVFAYELAQQTSLGERADAQLRRTEHYEQVDDYTTRAYLQPDLPTVNQELADSPSRIDLTNTDYLLSYWTPLPQHILVNQIADLADGVAFTELDFAQQPVGYGPYLVEETAQEGVQAIRLQRNPYYTATTPLPQADLVRFVIFDNLEELRIGLENGSIDVAVIDQAVATDLEPFTTNPEQIARAYVRSPVWEHLDFNLDSQLLDQTQARQAIALGTDRTAIATAILGEQGIVLDSWIMPEHWAAAPPDQLARYPYDPEQARARLAELDLVDLDDDGFLEQGIDHDSNGTLESSAAITLTLRTNRDSPVRGTIARRFQADMEAIGLRVEIVETPTEELFQADGPLFRRDFELVQFAWIANPDPRGFELWSCSAIPSATNGWVGSNLAGWCDREANELILTATTSLDAEIRRTAYIEHQRLFTNELPVLPLFQRLIAIVHTPRLVGLQPDPLAPITWNIAEWRRE